VTSEVVLRLYKLFNSNGDVDEELKRLGEFLKTRSQVVNGVEYLSVSKISKGDVKGLIVIRGDKEKAINEAQLISTLIKSNFRSIDIDVVTKMDVFKEILSLIKNFF
jgi:hypothetical protein